MVEHIDGHQCSARGESTPPRPSRITTTFVIHKQKGPEWIQKKGYENGSLSCMSTTKHRPVAWEQMGWKRRQVEMAGEGEGKTDAADEGGERERERDGHGVIIGHAWPSHDPCMQPWMHMRRMLHRFSTERDSVKTVCPLISHPI